MRRRDADAEMMLARRLAPAQPMTVTVQALGPHGCNKQHTPIIQNKANTQIKIIIKNTLNIPLNTFMIFYDIIIMIA